MPISTEATVGIIAVILAVVPVGISVVRYRTTRARDAPTSSLLPFFWPTERQGVLQSTFGREELVPFPRIDVDSLHGLGMSNSTAAVQTLGQETYRQSKNLCLLGA
ncbi:hypothetical protein BDW74DRAFT_158697 [Aspergillus multicolor]|uniref:uncharacterized protein n=1 Tax=Aspergillus multicolor TaxID=41759 RepID=UPI003CCE022A